MLLGYYSGHFSTPAFRVEEIYRLAEHWRGTPFVHLPLLLATVTYAPVEDDALASFLRQTTSGLPGIEGDATRELIEGMARMMLVPQIEWRRDPELGWSNNWLYSQRNPESSMSILGPADFEFIERFFAELER